LQLDIEETMFTKLTTVGLTVAVSLALGTHAQEREDPPTTEGAAELIGTVWQWMEFQDSAEDDEASTLAPDPEKYTLTLRSDGSAHIQADCNHLSWTYEREDSRLAFNTMGPGTLAHCGDQSLDQRYLQLLGDTATWVMSGDKLYLNLKADAGNMIFVAAR
jgi:heat shock protein HslJ